MKKSIIAFIFVLSLSACSPQRPLVCVSVYPMEYIVQRIGGTVVDLCNLSEGDYILKAQFNHESKELLDRASLIMYFGQLEPYFDVYRDLIFESDAARMDILSLTPVTPFKRLEPVMVGQTRIWLERRYYESVLFDMVDKYQQDPYVWLDPINMLSIARALKDFLVANYPENEAKFNANFTSLQNDLVLLDAQFQLLRNETNNIKFVSISPSFGHWQKAYNIQVFPVVLSRYGVLPNSAQLNIIKESIIANDVRYIAYEANLSAEHRELFHQLVEELDLSVINLSNLTTLSPQDKENNKDYLTIMLENLRLLESIGR